MRLDRLVQFVSDQRFSCRAMYFYSDFLSVHDFYCWNKQFLGHKFIKNNISLWWYYIFCHELQN